MNNPFREHHLFAFLESYEQTGAPLDLALHHYFRAHKSLGSKDRAFIAETVYALVRWQGLLDALAPAPASWERRFSIFNSKDWKKSHANLPSHIQVSFPKDLFDLIISSHGIEAGTEVCLNSNEQAPTTVRVNALKTSREELIQLWQSRYAITPCEKAPYGITFLKKMNFFELPEFKQGLFEMQDEGSQLLGGLVEASPGDSVMDYCAGSGGKTLAFAPRMQNRGQIYLHDIRRHALAECRKRLRRAGIQNAQIVESDEAKLKKLKKKMDWVLVDAPCSGTGTLRRNPDMKWKFTKEMLQRLVGQQRTIFERALSFVRPGGKIVYATCSLLKEENEEQTAHFLKIYPIQLRGHSVQTIPSKGGMDGFFGVVFSIEPELRIF